MVALSSIFIIKLILKFFHIYSCYQIGKALKNPTKYPFIPYPIENYPFQAHDVGRDVYMRLIEAERVIDNVLFMSHQNDVDDNEVILEVIREEALSYVSFK